MPIAELPTLNIAYERSGSGQPLLMIMGIGAQLIQWPAAFCQELERQGFELIKVDNRDSGLSTKLIDAGRPNIQKALLKRALNRPIKAPYTLEDMADDLAELIKFLKIDNCHVLGISMGSMIAQIFASKYQQHCRSLTLMHSNTGKLRHSLIKPNALIKLMGRGGVHNRGGAIQGFIELFEVIGSPNYKRSREEMMQFAGDAYDRAHHPPGFQRHMAAILATGDREDFYTQIQCPTAVIHGVIDPLMPLSGGKALEGAIIKAKGHFFEDLAHDIPDHYVSRFAQIIRDTADEQSD